MTSQTYQAVSLPLLGSMRLELRGSGVVEPCAAVVGLPPNWQGVPSNNGPFEVRRHSSGLEILRLKEASDIAWSVIGESKEELLAATDAFVAPQRLFRRTSKLGLAAAGTFKCVNYLGRLECIVRVSSQSVRVVIEVVSQKFSDEHDFETMTSDIAEHIQQLLLYVDAPTTIPTSVDVDRLASLSFERFLFLDHVLSAGRLEAMIEAILRYPQTRLSVAREWRAAAESRQDLLLIDPFRGGRDWCRTQRGVIPAEVRATRKFETTDTEANRFVAFALREFQSVCHLVASSITTGGGAASERAEELADTLSACLASPFFRELSPLTRLPLDSQVLQKRSGYRDILAVWLLSSQASRLDWTGRGDVYGGPVKNVATLYEYWLFFELRELLLEMDEIREIELGKKSVSRAFSHSDGILSVRLQRGKASLSAFEVTVSISQPLRIHLWFDRTFSPTQDVLAGGAYSRHFRPDFTLAVFPAAFAEGADEVESEKRAELAGEISYLHFDAKYRNDRVDQLFGSGDDSELDAEKNEQAGSVYRRADLYKMHTYNDAIRRTVASFVLYPGTSLNPTRFDKYHEIVPGVGAFAFSPTDSGRRAPLVGFLRDFFLQQSHRFSQHARLQYWTHDTVRERPTQSFSPHTIPTKAPAKDEIVVLGFVRSGESLENYRQRRVFFVHAIEWRPGTRQPGKATGLDFDPLRADSLVLFQGDTTAPWIAPVDNVSLVSAEERATELGRPLASMRAAYYFRFALGESYATLSRDVAQFVSRRPGRPVSITAAQFVACEPR